MLPALQDDKPVLTPEQLTLEKKQLLESAIFRFSQDRQDAFYASILQELNIRYSDHFPTACLTFDKKSQNYQIHLNYDFFSKWPLETRIAILKHEILHFVHKHIWRFEEIAHNEKERLVLNIAADLAINQFIQNLPPDALDIKKINFPPHRTMEEYYELLKKQVSKDTGKTFEEATQGEANKSMAKLFGKPTGKGDQPGQMVPGEGDGEPGGSGGSGNGPETLDQHAWGDMSEEDRKHMFDEAKKVLQRTVEKTQFGYTKVPEWVKDLIKQIEVEINKLNYKAILMSVIKRTMSVTDKENTWTRPSRRYGNYAPGMRAMRMPFCSMYFDTSGSISYREFTENLKMMEGFLKAGAKSCRIGLWHTALYHKSKFKRGSTLEQSVFQSGGTDPNCVLEDIKKTVPNLSVIFTDGYYDSSTIKIDTPVVWIITPNGNMDHPLKHIGRTIPLDGLRDGK